MRQVRQGWCGAGKCKKRVLSAPTSLPDKGKQRTLGDAVKGRQGKRASEREGCEMNTRVEDGYGECVTAAAPHRRRLSEDPRTPHRIASTVRQASCRPLPCLPSTTAVVPCRAGRGAVARRRRRRRCHAGRAAPNAAARVRDRGGGRGAPWCAVVPLVISGRGLHQCHDSTADVACSCRRRGAR